PPLLTTMATPNTAATSALTALWPHRASTARWLKTIRFYFRAKLALRAWPVLLAKSSPRAIPRVSAATRDPASSAPIAAVEATEEAAIIVAASAGEAVIAVGDVPVVAPGDDSIAVPVVRVTIAAITVARARPAGRN